MFTASDFELGAIELPEARKVDRRGQAQNLSTEDVGAIFAELPSDKGG
jgi:integrase/recombinase XerD